MIDRPAGESLSETEREILRLVATGATNREIGRARGISEATVKKHVTNINTKLGTGNRTEAARRALELGLVSVKVPGAEGDADDHQATAVALTLELERHRQHTRRVMRAAVITGIAGVAAVATLAWMYLSGNIDRGPFPTPPPPTPAATPVPVIWSPGVDLPSERAYLALAAEPPDPPRSFGSVYAIGGLGPDGVLSDTLRYDPKKLAWERRASKPTAVRDIAGLTVQGRIVVPGGCRDDGSAVDVTEIYDLDSDSWSAGPTLPRPACGYAMAETDGRIYLFGGHSRLDGPPERWVWSYQLGDSAWSEAPEPLPLARTDAAAVVVGSNEIHVLGGRDGSGVQSNHWLFRPFARTGQWATEGGAVLPEGRAGLGAVYHLGRIFVVGGGWDVDVEPWALVLERGGWQELAPLRLALPRRGAPMTLLATNEGQWLATAGGEASAQSAGQPRLLKQYSLYPLVRFSSIYITGPTSR